MPKTFIDELEDIVDIVSEWCVEVINDAVDKLSTNGRPFMMSEMTPQKQLEEYMKLIDSPDPQMAFVNYIDGKARDIINRLMSSNIPENEIVAIHPYDIASRHTIIWSAEMEALRTKHATDSTAVIPSSPAETTVSTPA